MIRILLVVYDWGEEWIVPFNIQLGGDVEIDVSIEDTPVRLQLFTFTLGASK